MRKTYGRLAAVFSLLLAGQAGASAPPEALLAAMGVPSSQVVPGSLTTVHPDFGPSSPTMFDVVSSLGIIAPYEPNDMAVMFTGNVDNVAGMVDNDYPPAGAAGDRATLAFALDVPADAQAYSFNFYFLSREYPEWVGDQYNDTFTVDVVNPAWTGQVVFDSFGNEVTVNSALFTVTDPLQLSGTGFDQDGGTGWVTTVAPCVPGSVLELRFSIADIGDGVWDSIVLLDNFEFGDEPPDGSEPWTGDPGATDPLTIDFLSPKEGPVDGGYEVVLHGSGFDPETRVDIGGVSVPQDQLVPGSGGETLTILSMPAADGPGTVDLALVRGDDTVVLGDAFTYWVPAEADWPPVVESVDPWRAHPLGGTTVTVTGTDFGPDATFLFVDEDGAEHPADAVGVVDLGLGRWQLVGESPEHGEGWADLVVVGTAGLRSEPGYPFSFDPDAARPPGDEQPTDCACASSAGRGAGAWLVLLLPLWTRRRRGIR